jgi:hypothetical protein
MNTPAGGPHSEYFQAKFRESMQTLLDAERLTEGQGVWVLPFMAAPYAQRYEIEALFPGLWLPEEHDQNRGAFTHSLVDETLYDEMLDRDLFSPGPYIRAFGTLEGGSDLLTVSYHDSLVFDNPGYCAQIVEEYPVEPRKVY